NGFQPAEYGLPFTHMPFTGSNGKFLSRRVYSPAGFASGTPLRSFYSLYERDNTLCQGIFPDCANANWRVKGDRVVYHDDGNRAADTTASDFDGLGHYRTEALGGTFASGNATTVTAFNQRDPDVNPSSGIDSGT